MLIKDIFFDIPNAHFIKNFILSFNFYKDERIYEPSYSRTHRNYYLFNKDPYILTVLESINDLQLFSEIIGKNKDVVYLKFFSWTLFDKPGILERTIFDYNCHLKKFPKHKIILLLNTYEEYIYFNKEGLECRFINHNALVDPKIFKPKYISKKYDIVYNGRLEIGKRHYLLKSCKNIALISASILRQNNLKLNYLKYLQNILDDAKILNFLKPIKLKELKSFKNMPILNPDTVSDIINQSKVGVILSHKEGACYASIEYLLCGIPVVSTANIGGRNLFLDKRFCKFSFSNSYSIKKTISKVLKENIPSDFIRSETIKNIQPHIEKIKKLIHELYIEYGITNADIDRNWDKFYINKMLKLGEKFPENLKKELK
mgnify:CR=1 FL=1